MIHFGSNISQVGGLMSELCPQRSERSGHRPIYKIVMISTMITVIAFQSTEKYCNRWHSYVFTLSPHCSLGHSQAVSFFNDLASSTLGSSFNSWHLIMSSIQSFLSCPNPCMLFSFFKSPTDNISKDANVSIPSSSSNSYGQGYF
jgi:hypothetical protein